MSDRLISPEQSTSPDSEPSRLARNASYLTIASVIQKAFTFFYFIYIANNVVEDDLGLYTFALSFTSIFGIFMDLGLGPILTREIAKHEEHQSRFFRAVLGAKIIIVPLFLILLSIVIWALYALFPTNSVGILDGGVDLRSVAMVYWATPIILLDTFSFTFYSVFRGRQLMKYEAIGIIIYQLLIVSLGSLVLFFDLPIQFLLLSIVAGSLFMFIYSGSLVVFVAKEKLRPTFEWIFTRQLLRLALPFALAGIFFKLSGSIDSVMLKVIAGNKFVAWYAVALKLATALTVLPGAFMTSLFPAISHALVKDHERAQRLFERSVVYIMVISLPIAAGTFVLSDELISAIYPPELGASAAALSIFMLSLFFVFLNYPVGTLLNAANRQTINTVNMGIALLVNVILNFFFIPRWTFIGAAWAAAISNTLLVLLGLPWARRVLKFHVSVLFDRGARVLASALLMAWFTSIATSLPLIVNVALSMVVYGVLLMTFGIITKNDLALVQKIFTRVARRVV